MQIAINGYDGAAWRARFSAGSILSGVVGALLAAAGLDSEVALAAEWIVDSRAGLTGEYNDNIFLEPEDELSVFGATVSPEIGVHGRQPNWDVLLNTRLDFARFTEDDSLDSEDVTVDFAGNYRTQVTAYGLDASFRRSNTRTSELTDTGRVNTRADRIDYEFLPYWNYALSPINSVFVNGGWSQTFFNEDDLNDFTEYFGGGGWRHRLTQQDTIILSGFVSHFENDDIEGNETDTYALEFGWERTFSNRLKVSLNVGPRYVSSDFVMGMMTNSDDSVGVVVDGSIDYDLDERTTLNASVARRVDGSGGGSAVERDVFELNLRHKLRPLVVLSLAARYQQNREPSDSNRGSDRDYAALEPKMSWEFERDWLLSGSYRFRTQELEGEDRAYSNAFLVTVSYRFPGWNIAD